MSYKLKNNFSPFFTIGRPKGVRGLTLHHGATTNFAGIGATFKTRGVSAGYGVNDNQNVERYVLDGNTAYHAGNWAANQAYIGIEHVNSTGAPDWKIAQSTFNTSVELGRNLAKQHGFFPLVPFKNLFPHGYFTPTFCPGVLKNRLEEYAKAVNQGASTAPSKPSKKKSNSTIANEVIAGSWGNGTDRTANLKRAGYNPTTIQKLVNKKLGGGGYKAPAKKSVSTIANEVIAGVWGTGDKRKAKLKAAGYNYNSVQAAVNKKLGVGTKALPSGGVFAVGQRVRVTKAVSYTGTPISVSGNYTVIEVRGSRIVIGRGGVVTAAINKSNLRKS